VLKATTPRHGKANSKMPEITQRVSSDANEAPARSRDDRSYLKELFEASKDAEKLISCFFDLNAIEGEPFQGIWERLASAIDTAEHALRPRYAELHEAANEMPFVRSRM
jgi:hypothetical protein